MEQRAASAPGQACGAGERQAYHSGLCLEKELVRVCKQQVFIMSVLQSCHTVL